FRGPRSFRIACWIVMAVNLVVGVWLAIAVLFIYWPAIPPLLVASMLPRRAPVIRASQAEPAE
ncbi:MAG: hypothetical protein JWO79_94, partial [Actinomycetia bacterium]|nr:hypothetical protein [Actinomycetes bacterium]